MKQCRPGPTYFCQIISKRSWNRCKIFMQFDFRGKMRWEFNSEATTLRIYFGIRMRWEFISGQKCALNLFWWSALRIYFWVEVCWEYIYVGEVCWESIFGEKCAENLFWGKLTENLFLSENTLRINFGAGAYGQNLFLWGGNVLRIYFGGGGAENVFLGREWTENLFRDENSLRIYVWVKIGWEFMGGNALRIYFWG